MAVIRNGINLLPVLPLDGGWVFHTLFFSRHHVLDAAFRLRAGVALLLGGWRLSDQLLMGLGVLVLIGVPSAYRLARITTLRRERRVSPGAPDDQTVSTETDVVILDELTQHLPKGQTRGLLAGPTDPSSLRQPERSTALDEEE